MLTYTIFLLLIYFSVYFIIVLFLDIVDKRTNNVSIIKFVCNKMFNVSWLEENNQSKSFHELSKSEIDHSKTVLGLLWPFYAIVCIICLPFVIFIKSPYIISFLLSKVASLGSSNSNNNAKNKSYKDRFDYN